MDESAAPTVRQASRIGEASDLRSDAARNRAKVIAAARSYLVREGAEQALPMNTIARLAGVGVGTVYRHFPNQQELIEGMAEDSLQTLVTVAQDAAKLDDAAAGFERLMRHSFDLIVSDAALAWALSAPEFVCPRTSQLGENLVIAVTSILNRARQSRVIRPNTSSDDIRHLLCGINCAVKAAGGDADVRETYLEVLLRGLRATG